MQKTTRTLTTLAHFAWNILFGESVLLVVVAILWRFTGWHTTAGFSTALATAGPIIIAVGLLGLAGGNSSDNMKLTEAEMEMRSWDRKGLRRFTSPYTERTRMWGWLVALGIATLGMSVVFNVFSP